MRIGIDARMYGPKQAGLGRYVEQLVLGLAEFDRENEYVLFFKRDNHECFATNYTNVKKVIADIPWYSWQEQVRFKKIIEKEKLDLMHFPHWNVPVFYNKPFVVTIHDLIMYHYPRQEASTHGLLVYWFKDRLHRLVLRSAVKRAKHIIVTSEFTKQDVNNTLNIALDKMSVIYQCPNVVRNEEKLRNLEIKKLENFGINKKYVLYVGSAYPHKNLEGLLKAWNIFCEKYSENYQLVLVGKKNFFYEKIIKEIEKLRNSEIDNIIFTDFLSDIELSQLYSSASLYVFPSLYEGFGLPPLEAMSYGVPVASSNASCLPEVLGEGALYFDPENYQQMADVIRIGLTDENVRFDLREKAKEELKRYSGERMAKQSLQVYKCVNV